MKPNKFINAVKKSLLEIVTAMVFLSIVFSIVILIKLAVDLFIGDSVAKGFIAIAVVGWGFLMIKNYYFKEE